MRLYNVNGKLVSKNVSRYRIRWDDKSRSKIQFKIKQFLKPYWINHLVYEEFPVYGSLLKVDILNTSKKIAVEVQGSQHETFNPFFHTTHNGFLGSIKRDIVKYDWLIKNDFKVIEIYQHEVDDVDYDFIKDKFDISL